MSFLISTLIQGYLRLPIPTQIQIFLSTPTHAYLHWSKAIYSYLPQPSYISTYHHQPMTIYTDPRLYTLTCPNLDTYVPIHTNPCLYSLMQAIYSYLPKPRYKSTCPHQPMSIYNGPRLCTDTCLNLDTYLPIHTSPWLSTLIQGYVLIPGST